MITKKLFTGIITCMWLVLNKRHYINNMIYTLNKKWKTCKTISQNVDSCSFWVVGKSFPLPLLVFSACLKFTALRFLRNFLVIIYFLKNQKGRKIFKLSDIKTLGCVLLTRPVFGKVTLPYTETSLGCFYTSDVSNSKIRHFSKFQILYKKGKARQEEQIC